MCYCSCMKYDFVVVVAYANLHIFSVFGLTCQIMLHKVILLFLFW